MHALAAREGAVPGDVGPVEILRGALLATKASGQPDWPTRVSVAYDLPPGTDDRRRRRLVMFRLGLDLLGAERRERPRGGPRPAPRPERRSGSPDTKPAKHWITYPRSFLINKGEEVVLKNLFGRRARPRRAGNALGIFCTQSRAFLGVRSDRICRFRLGPRQE